MLMHGKAEHNITTVNRFTAQPYTTEEKKGDPFECF